MYLCLLLICVRSAAQYGNLIYCGATLIILPITFFFFFLVCIWWMTVICRPLTRASPCPGRANSDGSCSQRAANLSLLCSWKSAEAHQEWFFTVPGLRGINLSLLEANRFNALLALYMMVSFPYESHHILNKSSTFWCFKPHTKTLWHWHSQDPHVQFILNWSRGPQLLHYCTQHLYLSKRFGHPLMRHIQRSEHKKCTFSSFNPQADEWLHRAFRCQDAAAL